MLNQDIGAVLFVSMGLMAVLLPLLAWGVATSISKWRDKK